MAGETIETDVLIVGAGPAGLATAIALKRKGFAGRVIVVEKGRAVGSHVLSGAVIDPSGFAGLLTEEELSKLPVEAHVTRESFRFVVSPRVSVKIPWVPPMMRAKGFPVGSLTKVVRYLSDIAVGLGVEIYTGYAMTELVEEKGVVVGARTGEKGLDSDGRKKSNYLPAEEIRAKVTVLAEGGAGILTDRLIAARHLEGRRPQSYALGIKELIELPRLDQHSQRFPAGTIMHTFGYPVDMATYGGGFVYHVSDTQVMVGYALGLDYRNAGLDPHDLFRKFKATTAVREHIAGGKSVAYGAKMIPEGGFYAMPRPYAPGVLIVGDGAGLLDGLRIKGIHIAIESGVAAGNAIRENEELRVKNEECLGERYLELLKQTRGYGEVKRVKNVHGGFTYGAPFGVAMAGFAWATFGAFPFWMFGKRERDSLTLKPLEKSVNRSVSQSVNSTSLFPDRLTDVFLSGTVHEENQPCHLKLGDRAKCAACAEKFGSPCTRFCPAEVYRLEAGALKIDFSNCLHCKTCKVKCPYGNVEWTFPQGGDGPRYTRL